MTAPEVTLRDQFAMAALASMRVPMMSHTITAPEDWPTMRDAAATAYAIADAMLIAREGEEA